MFLYHIKYNTNQYGLGVAAIIANNPNEAKLILLSQGSLNATPNSYNITLIREVGEGYDSNVPDLLAETIIDTTMFIGPKGTKGDLGIQGIKGETGSVGPLGILGPKGDLGDKGNPFTYNDFTQELLNNLIGPRGPQGILGEKGIKGDLGPRGILGVLGIQGILGPQGPAGDITEVTNIANLIYLNVSNALLNYKIRIGTSVSSEANTINFII